MKQPTQSEGMQDYHDALAIRNKYPEVLTRDQQVEIVEALPLHPNRPDMVGLALVHHANRHHANRKPNRSFKLTKI